MNSYWFLHHHKELLQNIPLCHVACCLFLYQNLAICSASYQSSYLQYKIKNRNLEKNMKNNRKGGMYFHCMNFLTLLLITETWQNLVKNLLITYLYTSLQSYHSHPNPCNFLIFVYLPEIIINWWSALDFYEQHEMRREQTLNTQLKLGSFDFVICKRLLMISKNDFSCGRTTKISTTKGHPWVPQESQLSNTGIPTE